MLRIKHLQTRLILLLVGLLVLVLAAVFTAVYTSTTISAERQARQRLEVGANVFQRLLELRVRELTNATQVLVADFGFREAVATGDLPTISSALLNQANRIGADQALFLSPDGQIKISSKAAQSGARVDLQAAGTLYADALLAVIDDQPHLLVEAEVKAPVTIGQVAMAFELNSELATEMKQLTGLDVSFLTIRSPVRLAVTSTLENYLGLAEIQTDIISKTIMGAEFLSVQIPLLQQDEYLVTAELLSPLDEALAMFDMLKRELILITLVALIMSSVVAIMLAGNLSRPVSRLADAARRIGLGDYSRPVLLARDDELGGLASSLDRMRQEISSREQQLLHNAYHDPLTGLANLSKVRDRLGTALAAGSQGTLTLLYLVGVEHLVNATGQTRVEELIKDVASRLDGALPANSMLGFQPGMGFLVVTENLDLDRSVVTADAMLTLLSKRVSFAGAKVSLQWLAGVVEWPRHSRDPDELLRQVGIAQSDAELGKDRIAVYQANLDQAYLRRMRIIRDLPYAPQLKELSVVFQPKLDLKTGQVGQVEALMRWTHPELGAVRPDEFIPLAEQTGSIRMLTQWMLLAVVSQLRTWLDKGIHLQVAMNISARDLEDPQFPERVAMVLQAQQISARWLSLEVTESALMKEPELSLMCLAKLRDQGTELAVDDYGTGYSSLATLKSLPVQNLKIDKSFVMQLADGTDDAIIVKSTIELAHNMGLKVVAEGIESAGSLAWLRLRGCDVGQGYFISRPVPALQLESWLETAPQRFEQNGI